MWEPFLHLGRCVSPDLPLPQDTCWYDNATVAYGDNFCAIACLLPFEKDYFPFSYKDPWINCWKTINTEKDIDSFKTDKRKNCRYKTGLAWRSAGNNNTTAWKSGVQTSSFLIHYQIIKHKYGLSLRNFISLRHLKWSNITKLLRFVSYWLYFLEASYVILKKLIL